MHSFLISLALLSFGALSTASADTEAGDFPNFKRVVLVTIDTLRADHVGSYGYFRSTTPFLDSLARRGIVFEHAFAHAPSTMPSHASMFTSTYPIQHGARRNGFNLKPSARTLAEVLLKSGFKTAAFVSASVLGRSTQIGQGFEVFHDMKKVAGLHYQPANVTTDRVIRWLKTIDDEKKLFLWLHYFDAHNPYHAPKEFEEIIGPDDFESFEKLSESFRGKQLIDIEGIYGGLDRILLYDAEIRFVDTQLQRIYNFANTSDTLWVITSDHGEGLGNHGYFGHALRIYNEQLSVPLILHWETKRSAQRVTEMARHIDLAPTILDLIGISPDKTLPEREGRPLLSRGPFSKGNLAYTFSQFGGDREACGDIFALQTPKDKLITDLCSGYEELFDLESDPYETTNLAKVNVDRVRELRTELNVLLHRIIRPERSYGPQKLDEKTRAQLRSLGYLQRQPPVK